METLEKELLEAIRQDRGYDYMAQYGHLMSNEQMKRVIMECLYEISHSIDKKSMLNNIADEIEDFWGY